MVQGRLGRSISSTSLGNVTNGPNSSGYGTRVFVSCVLHSGPCAVSCPEMDSTGLHPIRQTERRGVPHLLALHLRRVLPFHTRW